ncbi:PepSY domain-containing protein [Ruegeria faecimaris]|uniref:Peptidase propeptide and YPEB domain-containing protein n=1 Tax=Ruegeria faecimaris TaxID=686389 RepID=A0A521FAG5_9RHOB|nr:PepSY domain-containing protein [Ruegeria faecimaris]SMO92631.1 Peptidase propeptide and YPEB domain-containing protein [Ruegeria faecimaris]
METFKMLTLTGLIATAPVLAFANVTVGDKLGTTETDIRTTLEAQGYQIEEIEFEDGEIEVELVKDGVETELVLNKTDGVVTAIELEEDDD